MLDHHHLLDELERRVEAAWHAISERRRECARLRERLDELEATRLELLEENRELDEQNSELEAHNRHLLEKLAAGETHGGFLPPTRRAQGLAALIGHRPRPNVASPPPKMPKPKAAVEAAVADEAPAQSAPDEPPSEPRQAEPPSPQALLAQWYRRYPATFFKGHTRPLKVGIHRDLAAHEPWPEKLVRRALAGYVNLPRYLKAVREGDERIDLEGQAAGTVDAQAAEHARQKLERLQASRAGNARQGQRRGDAPPRDTPANEAGDGDEPATHKARGGKPGDTRSEARKPAAQRASEPPATLEDKLSALLAKHNRQG